MIRFALISLCILCLAPAKAMAIEISEIAWMGSPDSANHEWIELYSPEAIDITGWSISDGNNLQIELSGTINAGQYAVLERTSDASAPGTAWQIYTGALVNAGATLTLRDESGGVVDRVVSGEDWELLGGDNTTKATAQLSANGWITADPTPGQAASGIAQAVISDQDDQAKEKETNTTSSLPTASRHKSASAQSMQLTLPDITLQLSITAPETTYVNQPVTLTVTPSGVGKTIASSLDYTWSFGDTNTATGKTVEHVFQYPGNYVVVVEAEYKRQIQRTRHQIVVLPVSLTLNKLDNGDIAIQNNSQTEIDLGGYRLVGNQSFTIPDYTIVLPRSEIVINHNKLQTAPIPQMVALYDQADGQVATHVPAHLAIQVASPIHQQPVARPTPRISAIDDSPRYTFASAAAATTSATAVQADPSSVTPAAVTARDAQVAAAGMATVPTNWPQYALVAVLLLGIAAVYLIPQPVKDEGPLA